MRKLRESERWIGPRLTEQEEGLRKERARPAMTGSQTPFALDSPGPFGMPREREAEKKQLNRANHAPPDTTLRSSLRSGKSQKGCRPRDLPPARGWHHRPPLSIGNSERALPTGLLRPDNDSSGRKDLPPPRAANDVDLASIFDHPAPDGNNAARMQILAVTRKERNLVFRPPP